MRRKKKRLLAAQSENLCQQIKFRQNGRFVNLPYDRQVYCRSRRKKKQINSDAGMKPRH